jgi:hypothetical protein
MDAEGEEMIKVSSQSVQERSTAVFKTNDCKGEEITVP